MRVISLAAAIGFAVLAIASPLITALTIGNGEPLPWVEVALFAAVWVAGAAYCVTYVAERREIAYRVAREETALNCPTDLVPMELDGEGPGCGLVRL